MCRFGEIRPRNAKKRRRLRYLPINSMTQARNAWFFKDPLSAVVTVTEEGFFRIDGSETQWLYGIEPDYDDDGMKPSIADRQVWLWSED